MAVVTKEDEALQALQERMRGARSGEVEVLDVRLEYRLDEASEEYVRVTLILSDPAPGRETWPLQSVKELYRRAYAEVGRLEITSYLAVTVETRDDYEDVRGGDR